MKRESIVILTGPRQGETIELIGSLTIGRSPENLLQLSDPQISRKHAVIQQTPQGTFLRDLGSGNGTFVDNRKVIEYRLAPGDQIQVGPLAIRYEVDDDKLRFTPPPPPSNAAAPSVQFGSTDNAAAVRSLAADDLNRTLFGRVSHEQDPGKLQRLQERLAAIYEANQMIAAEHDLRRVFECVLEQVFRLIPAHNGVILLLHPETGELITEYARTRDGETPPREMAISRTIAMRSLHNGEAVITLDAMADRRFEAGASIIAQKIASAMCAPLRNRQEILGVIYVDTRGTRNAFDENDLQLLNALAGPAGIAIKNARYVQELERDHQENLCVLANAIEIRDHYTVGHTWRVTNFAIEIGRALGWTDEQIRTCRMGGVLHDIGKIGVEDAILRKASALTPEEYEVMKVHPERGARLMQDARSLVPLIPFALYHHERYDGKGYPFGLAGENIPIEGRVLAVADTFDAMTSNRPYRKGLDPEIALGELEKGKRAQFDPDCVDALVAAYRAGRISSILQEFHKRDAKSIVCPFCSTYFPTPTELEPGDSFACSVCHRRLRLLFQNDAYYAELIPATTTPLP